MSKARVAILGGGIAGLAAAHRLAVRGMTPLVIEKEDRVGGISGSVDYHGYIFDFGPQAYGSIDESIYSYFKSFCTEGYSENPKHVVIKFSKGFYRYPLEAYDILRNLSPGLAARCAWDYLRCSLVRPGAGNKERSTEEWLVNRFGKNLYKIFFHPYTTKVWGMEPSELDASFAFHRIPYTGLGGLFKNSFRKGIQRLTGREHEYARAVFIAKGIYPARGGSGAIPESMARQIKELGGEILCGSKVTELSLEGDRVSNVIYEIDGSRQDMRVDNLISTIPVGDFLQMLSPPIPFNIAVAIDDLNYRSLKNVCLVVASKPMFAAQSIYFMDKPFHRLTCINNFRGNNIPDGMTGLMVELSCRFGDATWDASTEDLVSRVVPGLEAEGFLRRAEIVDSFVLSVRHAYPVYRIGYETGMNAITAYISGLSNVLTGGRQGMYKYVDKDLAVKAGFEMADFILSGMTKDDISAIPYAQRLFA